MDCELCPLFGYVNRQPATWLAVHMDDIVPLCDKHKRISQAWLAPEGYIFCEIWDGSYAEPVAENDQSEAETPVADHPQVWNNPDYT